MRQQPAAGTSTLLQQQQATAFTLYKKRIRKNASVSVLVKSVANKVPALLCNYFVVKHARPVIICCCCFYCCNIVHIYGRSVPQMQLSICCWTTHSHIWNGLWHCCLLPLAISFLLLYLLLLYYSYVITTTL